MWPFMTGSFHWALCFQGFIHAVAGFSTSFPFLTEWHSVMWMNPHWVSTHQSTDLGFVSTFWTMLLWTAVNQVLYEYVFILPEYVARGGIAGGGNFNILRNDQTVLRSGGTDLHSRSSVWGLQFSAASAKNYFSLSVSLVSAVAVGVTRGAVVVVACISLITNEVEHLHTCLSATGASSLEKGPFIDGHFVHFKIGLSFCCWKSSFYILDTSPLSHLWFATIVIYFGGFFFFFHFLNNVLWSTNICGVSEVWFICFCHQKLLCHS